MPPVQSPDGNRLGITGGVIPAAFAVVAGRSDDSDPGPVGLDHHIMQRFAPGLHAEAHINDVDLVLHAPVDAEYNIGDIGGAAVVKSLDRIEYGPRSYAHHAACTAGGRQRTGNMCAVSVIIERQHAAVKQIYTRGERML